MKLQLQVNSKFAEDTNTKELAKIGILITPPVGKDDYWLYRVELDNGQAVIGFPKFGTVGIGFEIEDDWNTNLPFTCEADRIYNHIKHNKKPSKATKQKVIKAIELIKKIANKEGK